MTITRSVENTCPDCKRGIEWASILDGETRKVTPFGDCGCDGRQWQEDDDGAFADTEEVVTSTDSATGVTKITVGDVTADVWYDRTSDPSRPAWIAEYFVRGEPAGDSEKVSHPEMPTDAADRAEAIHVATEQIRKVRRG